MVYVPLDSAAAVSLLGRFGQALDRFPGELEKTLIGALNRTGTAVRTGAVKILADRYTAQRADIMRKIRVEKASGRQLGVMILGRGRPIHLGRWNSQTKTVNDSSGVLGGGKRKYRFATVQILQGGMRKVVKDGFLGVSSKNRHTLLFKRMGAGRYPIKGLYGPSMIGHLTESERLDELQLLAKMRLEKALKREAESRLQKLGML